LTFALPRPEDRGRVNGEVHLKWSGVNIRTFAAEVRVFPQPAPASAESEDKAEARLEALLAKMTPAQREGFRASVPKKAPTPDATALPLAQPVLLREVRAALVAQRPVPRVRAVIDGDKAAREQAKFQALRKAFGGQLPGYTIPPGAPPAPAGATTPGR
jgi:hypothetical protein